MQIINPVAGSPKVFDETSRPQVKASSEQKTALSEFSLTIILSYLGPREQLRVQLVCQYFYKYLVPKTQLRWPVPFFREGYSLCRKIHSIYGWHAENIGFLISGDSTFLCIFFLAIYLGICKRYGFQSQDLESLRQNCTTCLKGRIKMKVVVWFRKYIWNQYHGGNVCAHYFNLQNLLYGNDRVQIAIRTSLAKNKIAPQEIERILIQVGSVELQGLDEIKPPLIRNWANLNALFNFYVPWNSTKPWHQLF